MQSAPGAGPALALLLLLALPQGPAGQGQNYSYVMTCQPGDPKLQLSAIFNDDEMFHFDFQKNRTVAGLPDLQRWEQSPFDADTISYEDHLCQLFQPFLYSRLTNITPQIRANPVIDVFTHEPLVLGKPNTLICYVSNFYPPDLNITWLKKENEPVSESIRTTDYHPTKDLGFYIFSYLDIIPARGDIYKCSVTHGGEKYSTITSWLPKEPLPSDLLENVLCGLAFCIGIVCLVVGVVLLVQGHVLQQTGSILN